MTELELQTLIASYVNRSAEEFVQGENQVNVLRLAINNAKKWAQRKLDFELARREVLVNVSPSSGGLLNSAVDKYDGSGVLVNTIQGAYLGYTQSAGGQAYAFRPILITTKATMARRNTGAWSGLGVDVGHGEVPYSVCISEPALIRIGEKIFISPITTDLANNGTDIKVGLDVTAWMPEYSDQVQSDFFLDYCSDWLMYRTIRELNFFIKDANRVVVTSGMVDEAWEVVMDWNASLKNNNDNDLN